MTAHFEKALTSTPDKPGVSSDHAGAASSVSGNGLECEGGAVHACGNCEAWERICEAWGLCVADDTETRIDDFCIAHVPTNGGPHESI